MIVSLSLFARWKANALLILRFQVDLFCGKRWLYDLLSGWASRLRYSVPKGFFGWTVCREHEFLNLNSGTDTQ